MEGNNSRDTAEYGPNTKYGWELDHERFLQPRIVLTGRDCWHCQEYCSSSGWRDGLVVSALDQRPRGRGFESAGCGLSCNNRGLVAVCNLGLGLLNPPSSRGLDLDLDLDD